MSLNRTSNINAATDEFSDDDQKQMEEMKILIKRRNELKERNKNDAAEDIAQLDAIKKVSAVKQAVTNDADVNDEELREKTKRIKLLTQEKQKAIAKLRASNLALSNTIKQVANPHVNDDDDDQLSEDTQKQCEEHATVCREKRKIHGCHEKVNSMWKATKNYMLTTINESALDNAAMQAAIDEPQPVSVFSSSLSQKK